MTLDQFAQQVGYACMVVSAIAFLLGSLIGVIALWWRAKGDLLACGYVREALTEWRLAHPDKAEKWRNHRGL